MAAPVSITFMPRTMPSVGCIATERTRFSPMCCSTSQTMSIGAAPADVGGAWMRSAL